MPQPTDNEGQIIWAPYLRLLPLEKDTVIWRTSRDFIGNIKGNISLLQYDHERGQVASLQKIGAALLSVAKFSPGYVDLEHGYKATLADKRLVVDQLCWVCCCNKHLSGLTQLKVIFLPGKVQNGGSCWVGSSPSSGDQGPRLLPS